MNKNIYGVILAGGNGSRLWPLSREAYPKQLLKLTGEKSLFQSTFLRLSNLILKKNILTVTNNKHLSEINLQLKELSTKEHFIALGEPVGRNTAPAIGLAVCIIKNILSENDPVIFVSPSDHYIKDEKEFLKSLSKGLELAEKGYIVTFGIKPSRPETGYGYIKVAQNSSKENNVEEFKEKPDFKTAEKYLQEGNYFWNAGIFMFKASTMLEEMKLYCPEILEGLEKINLSGAEIDKELYEQIPSISIDYAVMEKSDKIALISVDCGWNDLGAWDSIYDIMEKDEFNNYTQGDVIAVDTKNSYIYGSSRLVSVIGLENVVVVETKDAVMVCDKSKTQDVKIVFEQLKKQNRQEF